MASLFFAPKRANSRRAHLCPAGRGQSERDPSATTITSKNILARLVCVCSSRARKLRVLLIFNPNQLALSSRSQSDSHALWWPEREMCRLLLVSLVSQGQGRPMSSRCNSRPTRSLLLFCPRLGRFGGRLFGRRDSARRLECFSIPAPLMNHLRLACARSGSVLVVIVSLGRRWRWASLLLLRLVSV